MNQKKKMAAAIAAVSAYIKSEEEALCLQAAAPAEEVRQEGPAAGPANLWGLSGRQALMQMGTMMQLKAFHRR